MLDSIVCIRAIQGGSFSSEPGHIRFLKVPDKKSPDPSHEIDRTAFIGDVVGTPKAQKCEDLVIFVHGYNVTQSDLIERHRSIRTSLAKAGYKGEFISFDWPAKGNAAKNHNPFDSVLKLSNVKRLGVAPRAGRVGLPEPAPAKAVGVDCGARFLTALIIILTEDTELNVIPSLIAFQSIRCRISLIRNGSISSATLSTDMHQVGSTSRGRAPVPVKSRGLPPFTDPIHNELPTPRQHFGHRDLLCGNKVCEELDDLVFPQSMNPAH